MGILLDKSALPNDAVLKDTLGKSFKFWLEIKEGVIKNYGPVKEEWKFYSAKSGWTMKLLSGKRNLLFISPFKGYFLASFIFGEKGVESVLKSGVDERIKEDLKGAVKYAEGRGVAIEVRSGKNGEDVLELVKIKINS